MLIPSFIEPIRFETENQTLFETLLFQNMILVPSIFINTCVDLFKTVFETDSVYTLYCSKLFCIFARVY